MPSGLDLDVARLQIAVDDALLVRGFERIGDLARDGERLLERNRALLDPLGERLALDQLHDQVVRADVEQRADIGMVQRGDGARLALEAVAEPLGGDLHRHFAVQAGIGGAIDLAHAARADLFEDLVGAQSSPR